MTGENFRRFSIEYPGWVMAMIGEYRILKKAVEYESYKIRDGETDSASRYWKLRDDVDQYWNKMLHIFMRDYSNKTEDVEAFERRFK